METALTAPTASAMAGSVLENEKRSRMIASLCLSIILCAAICDRRLPDFTVDPSLLERILFHTDKISSVVLGRRMRATALGIGELFHARSEHQRRMTIVAFDTAGLVVDAVLLLALPIVLELGSPGSRPHRRIVNRDHIFERVGPGACPTLDEMQVLARAQHVCLGAEVGDVDDERIALEAPARIAVPLADGRRQMRPSVHHDVALPALALADVVKHRDAAWRLHDAPEAAAIGGAKLGQPQPQAAHPHRPPLPPPLTPHPPPTLPPTPLP